jgi:hypothetical protein
LQVDKLYDTSIKLPIRVVSGNFRLNLTLRIFYYSHFRFIVLFTIERFLVVYFPFSRGTVSRKKSTILAIVIISTSFYSFSLFSSNLKQFENKMQCVTFGEWFELAHVFVMFDVALTMIVPFILISIFNFLIVIRLNNQSNHPFEYSANKRSFTLSMGSIEQTKTNREIKQNELKIAHKRFSILSTNYSELSCLHKRLFKKSPFAIKSYTNHTTQLIRLKANSIVSTCSNYETLRKIRAVKQLKLSDWTNSKLKIKFKKTTCILLFISTCFLCLNMPITICKIFFFIYPNMTQFEIKTINRQNKTDQYLQIAIQGLGTDLKEKIAERLACFIYYLNFSVNFFLYNWDLLKMKKTFAGLFSSFRQFVRSQLK